ncbi:MAG: D-alanyl-D-alanine carboxypeptidase [Lachnospiraceae bacterium]|nr:D-alanyl-D-alanine carboxypeptidase [Lachnospiraceae bacterium]
MKNIFKRIAIAAIALTYGICALFIQCGSVYADEVEESEESSDEETADDLAAQRKSIEVESNDILNWPQGPAVVAESAILMEAETGTILYDKNMDKVEYPASTTKVLTCLLAAENCAMDEIVTFSQEAVFGIERSSSNVGIDVGEELTMEDAIYCIMLASANEVAAAVAEHVSGSIEEFCELMNKRAAELGCTNTHFVNANGLPNDDHYTTAHDLALIAQAYNRNETLVRIGSTVHYTINPTPKQKDTIDLYNHHKMYSTQKYYYEPAVWGKTGYTNVARSTLVTTAEKDGLNLICIVMKDEPGTQYTDTEELFEYGFNNFKKEYIADNETAYDVSNADFFDTDADIFGNSTPLLALNTEGYCILPKNAEFSDLNSTVVYDTDEKDENSVAKVIYDYEGNYVGETTIDLYSDMQSFKFGDDVMTADEKEKKNKANTINEDTEGVVFISIKKIIIIASVFVGGVVLVFLIIALVRYLQTYNRRRRRISKRARHYFSEFDDFDF